MRASRGGSGWSIGQVGWWLVLGAGCRAPAVTVPAPPPAAVAQAREEPSTPPPIEAIATNYVGTCVLQGGEVRCWGERGPKCGEVGDEHVVSGLPPVTAIFAGSSQTCAVGREGGVWCWEYEGAPERLPAAAANEGRWPNLDAVQTIVPFRDQVYVLDRQGVVGMWQRQGTTLTPREMQQGAVTGATALAPGHSVGAVAIVAGALRDLRYKGWQPRELPPIAEVAHADRMVCARDDAGRVYCWQPFDRGGPPFEVMAIPPAAQIVAGADHVCARTRDGELWCWGRGERGQLGLGTAAMAAEWVPPQRVPGLDRVRLVTAMHHHTCAVTGDAGVYCWGDNEHGQLGFGGFSRAPRAWPAEYGQGKIDAVVAGEGTCVLGDGALRCAGPTHGQARTRFEALPGATGVSQAAMGRFGICAAVGERVVCWQERGQAAPAPFVVPAAPPGTVDLAVSDTQACAVGSDRLLRCWGYEAWYASQSPLRRWREEEVVGPHHCGQRADGRGGCWSFGLTPLARSTLPAPYSEGAALPVRGVAGALAVAMGPGRMCTHQSDGRIWCQSPEVDKKPRVVPKLGGAALGPLVMPGWGVCRLDDEGVVRCDGFAVPASLPRASELVAGREHACVLAAQGAVYCWGGNDDGQLGDGTCAAREDAVRVALPGPARALAAGAKHSCALLADGALWCWGDGRDGAAYERTPVRVASPTRRGGPAPEDALPPFAWEPLPPEDGFERTIDATLRERLKDHRRRDCFTLEAKVGRCDARGDLDGDGLVDRVVTIRLQRMPRPLRGLAVLYGNGQTEVLGAGEPVAGLSLVNVHADVGRVDVTRDFVWLEAWAVVRPGADGFVADRELDLIGATARIPPLPDALGDVIVMTEHDVVVALYRTSAGWRLYQRELEPR